MPVLNAEPWWVPESIPFADDLIQSAWRVLEFGSGGSTIWIADRCDQIISVDDSPIWASRVNAMKRGNVSMKLRPRPYHGICQRLRKESFDMVVVDGRDRVACMRAAKPLIRVGGWMVLDNAERDKYKPGSDLFSGWIEVFFMKMIVNKRQIRRPWKTHFWQRQD